MILRCVELSYVSFSVDFEVIAKEQLSDPNFKIHSDSGALKMMLCTILETLTLIKRQIVVSVNTF